MYSNRVSVLMRKYLSYCIGLCIVISLCRGLEIKANAAVTINQLPFTYTGAYTTISEYTTGKFYIILTGNGVLTPKSDITVDIFIVNNGAKGANGSEGSGNSGGKGGNGGAGSTNNGISLSSGVAYNAVISTATSIAGRNSTTGTRHTGGVGGAGVKTGKAGVGGDGYKAFGGDKAPFSSMYYGGGGGGGVSSGSGHGSGGLGGGGLGGQGQETDGTRGTASTGGGGGGGGGSLTAGTGDVRYGYGGAGGTGAIIVRGDLEGLIAPNNITTPSSIKYNNEYTIQWGNASGIGATVSGYILEQQINGGTWTKVYEGMETTYTHSLTRDEASKINYRVKAYGVGGVTGSSLETSYTTGVQRDVINNMSPTIPVVTNTVNTVEGWGGGVMLN